MLKQRDLFRTLTSRGIEELHLCGIDTDACVLATAYDAFDLNFRVKVLFDLCYSRYHVEDTLEKIILRNIQTKDS